MDIVGLSYEIASFQVCDSFDFNPELGQRGFETSDPNLRPNMDMLQEEGELIRVFPTKYGCIVSYPMGNMKLNYRYSSHKLQDLMALVQGAHMDSYIMAPQLRNSDCLSPAFNPRKQQVEAVNIWENPPKANEAMKKALQPFKARFKSNELWDGDFSVKAVFHKSIHLPSIVRIRM